MILVGIDPGMSGAIAIQWEKRIQIEKMPKNTLELMDLLKKLPQESKVYCENVALRPADIGPIQNIGKAIRMQKLFSQFKQLITLLELVGVTKENGRLITVMPHHWQKKLNIYVKGEDYQKRKSRLAKIAQEKFNPIKIIKQNADAALILLYAAKMENKQLKHIQPTQLDMFK